jgi:hypothetical protein
MLSCSGVTGAVKEAIETLQESGATAFVLDIRNNSGGLFPAGIEIAKMWYAKRTSFAFYDMFFPPLNMLICFRPMFDVADNCTLSSGLE